MSFTMPSWNDIVESKTTWETQAAGLLIAMVLVKLFMKIGIFVFSSVIKAIPGLLTKRIRLMKGFISNPRGFDYDTEFQDFCKPGQEDFFSWRERKTKEISDADYNLTTPRRAKNLLQGVHAVDAYIGESDNRVLFEDFICHSTARSWMVQFQHGIVGILAFVALFFTPDADTQGPVFQKFVRYSMLCEAGFELDDWIFNIIPTIARGKGDKMVFVILHHFCLYGLFPANLYAVSGPMGEDIAWALVLFAGTFLPIWIVNTAGELLDDTHSVQRWLHKAMNVSIVAVILWTRGPLWWGTAYNFVTKSAEIGDATYYFFWLLVIMFQGCNIIFYVGCFFMLKQAFCEKQKDDNDNTHQVLFATAMRALLNPDVFALMRQHRARTRWAKVRAAWGMNMLMSDSGRIRLKAMKRTKQQQQQQQEKGEANKKTD